MREKNELNAKINLKPQQNEPTNKIKLDKFVKEKYEERGRERERERERLERVLIVILTGILHFPPSIPPQNSARSFLSPPPPFKIGHCVNVCPGKARKAP